MLIIHITIRLLHHLHLDMKTTTILILPFSGSVCTAAGRLGIGESPSTTSDLSLTFDLRLTSVLLQSPKSHRFKSRVVPLIQEPVPVSVVISI